MTCEHCEFLRGQLRYITDQRNRMEIEVTRLKSRIDIWADDLEDSLTPDNGIAIENNETIEALRLILPEMRADVPKNSLKSEGEE